MDSYNQMRAAAGLPVETAEQSQIRCQRETAQENREFKNEVRDLQRHHILCCSLSDQIDGELNRVKLGSAERATVDGMAQDLLAAARGVAMNSAAPPTREALTQVVAAKIDAWILENPVLGKVLRDSAGAVERMTANIVDSVMQTVAVRETIPATAIDSPIGNVMKQAAGLPVQP